MRAWKITQPDGTSLTNEFFPTGLRKKTYGSRQYPVEYTYDYAGRVLTMKTWRDFASPQTAAVTGWGYDPKHGWLTYKDYPDPVTGQPPEYPATTGPTYQHTFSGRLSQRQWRRYITTSYDYDAAGNLSGVTYSPANAAPDLNHYCDRLGRLTNVTQTLNGDSSAVTMAYNLAGELLSESWSGGVLAGLSVTNGYDTLLRRTTLAALNSSTPLLQHSFSFDAASRLKTAADGSASVTYAYLANSPLVSQISFTNSGAWRMTTTKQYDLLNRLTQISSVPSASSVVSFSYQYNAANQRTRRTESDASCWSYQYDTLGQVTSGKRFWSDWTPVAGQQFEYTFDDIGNRTSTRGGGDSAGANLRSANYSANTLNQYTSRDVPGFVDVMGIGLATNAVTVNAQTAYRKGEYFRQQLAVGNSSTAMWTNITVSETGQTPVSGNVFVAKTPENFGYDLDGNLTSDGRWTYAWDAENRLTNMTSLATAPTGSKFKLDFIYDAVGRRIQKLVSTNNGSVYVSQYTNRFIYDGWNLVCILNPQSTALRSFLWGSDLSGSMQGAGGVGGLLEINDFANGVHFAAFDGNGNVAGLVKAADGTLSAQYEYGPFGELLRTTGPVAKTSPFRFSTKYQDDETDLLYYGYRYLSASTGMWLSRDPAEEDDGSALYRFVQNAAVDEVDYLGEFRIDQKARTVYLAKCDIAILYGHGSGLKRKHWRWVYADAGCSAGAGVMCWADTNMDGLEETMRLWTKWGGEDISEANWEKVVCGAGARGPDFVRVGWAQFPNADKVLIHVLVNAVKKGWEICDNKSCHCKKVIIRFVQINNKGEIVDPPRPDNGVPQMPKQITITCPGGVISCP